jgi:hypothetical protein
VLILCFRHYFLISRIFAGNYLAHTQGKRHQQNIARRLAKDAFEQQGLHPGATKTDPKTQRKVDQMFLVRQRVCVFVSVCVHGCAFACVVLRVVWVYATGQCRW